jgi:GxxExxY protein
MTVNHQGAKPPREEVPAELDAIARQIVNAAFAVHSALGPGLLESVYETCLVHELTKRSLKIERQRNLPVVYDGVRIDAGLRFDLVVQDLIVVELKTVESVLPVHRAQVITYLKLSKKRLGFLINFNITRIKDGIQRIIL